MHTYILRKSALATPEYISEHVVSRLKPFDVSANRFHSSGHIRAEYCVFWFEQPTSHEANEENVGGQEMPVSRIDRCRLNFHQYFIVLGRRLFDLPELKNIG